jgi:hypothetical protein
LMIYDFWIAWLEKRRGVLKKGVLGFGLSSVVLRPCLQL